MTSPVRLISVRQILETSAEEEFIGMRQMNDIGRRRTHKSSVSNNESIEDESRRRERFSFPSGLVSGCNVSEDTNKYGSPFVEKWYLEFTNGKRKVTFGSIFPVLVEGLREEGKTERENVVRDIMDSLNKIKDECFRKREKKRMKELENYCAKLYTKQCFIYNTVNIALRDNDPNKIRTLGPYCFLLFNYVGRHPENDVLSHRLSQRSLRPTESPLIRVFRGDYISTEMLQKYQQAAGDTSKYFKGLSFISTSRDREVAEFFARNVVYIIELQHCPSKDQLVDLSTISDFPDEKEILFQPGVRFQVAQVKFDDTIRKHLVHINIVPSYMSILK
ncbi:unnamed protein product [Rotaria sp. Silwood1]|nr:unnamed protein product [Rotaria sp. Silwood1]CAF4881989.1 unnamed protein product [Rotaria sp. Silwood1]